VAQRLKRRPWLVPALGAVLVAGFVSGLVALLSGGSHPRPGVVSRPLPAAKGFHVERGRIIAPDGRVFLVKGVVAVYGTFAGGDQAGLGAVNYSAARSDFALLRHFGANTVRIFVTPATAAPNQFARLRQAVAWARQQGLVVELSNAFSDFAATVPWLHKLAATFKDDPYVWLEPMNEPGCSPKPDPLLCGNWQEWQSQERAYISAIRSAGMTAPIVINTPNWSSSVEQVAVYPLGDPNLVFGVHDYGNNRAGVAGSDVTDYQRSWASTDGPLAVMVDEVGSWNGDRFANSANWLRQFVALVRGWVMHGRGSGAIGFVWRWSDPNTMTSGNQLTDWGRLFVRDYLQAVPGER
jgi:Cellulase (glycosyl hydrolase family 5)